MAVEPWIELGAAWGIPAEGVLASSAGPIGIATWRHTMPQIPDSDTPVNTLGYVLSPFRAWHVAGSKRQATPTHRGGMGYIPKGTYGRWDFGEDAHIAHFYFPDHVLSNLQEQAGFQATSTPGLRLHVVDPMLGALAGEAIASLEHGSESRLYLDTLGTAMALRLLRAHFGTTPKGCVKGGLARWQLKRVTDAMLADLSKDIGLAELASLVGLTTFHFCRAFHQSTGLPPHRWRTTRRLEYAAMLLRTTNMAITDISVMVGAGSPSHFATAFRRTYAMSPSAYRRT